MFVLERSKHVDHFAQLLAAILLATNEHAEAETVITELATEKPLNAAELAERNRMLKYIDVLAEAAAEDRNAYQLTSLEVAVLDSMAADHYDRPSVWASNLLCAVYGICRAPYTGGGDGLMELQSLMEQPAAVPSAINPALLLQPNPASSGVTMVYSLPGNRGSAKLLVRDISGRIVQELTIGGEQGQATWTVQQVVPGVYSVELLCNGRMVGIERLVIQR